MRYLLVILPLFLCSISFAGLKIVIDPGHGGTDNGAVRGKIREADIALNISKQLAELLREQNHSVVLTRSTDKALTLEERIEFAEREQGDLLISIHANASEDQRAHGAEFYFQNQLPPDEEAVFLASRENHHGTTNADRSLTGSDIAQILADLRHNFKLQSSFEFSKLLAQTWTNLHQRSQRNRIIRQAPFRMVSLTTMPSVLVEVGFVSHKSEGPLLTASSHQREIATQVAKAVQLYSYEIPVNSSARSLASPKTQTESQQSLTR